MEHILITGFLFLTAVIWIWALIDLFKSEFDTKAVKGLWLLAILFFPVLGSLVYFQLGKKSGTRARRRFQPNFPDRSI